MQYVNIFFPKSVRDLVLFLLLPNYARRLKVHSWPEVLLFLVAMCYLDGNLPSSEEAVTHFCPKLAL